MTTQSSIAVPDSGPRQVETQRIEQPDGTIVERQRVDPLITEDVSSIRKLVERMFFIWTTKNPIVPRTRRAMPFDPAGNLAVGPGVSPAGGAKVSRLIAAASTNATLVKSVQGQVYGWFIFNAAAAVRFVKLYNVRQKPVPGTDIPTMTLPLPSGAAANVWCGSGIGDFSEGIGYATTVNAADSDTTAVTAGDLIINLWWA